MNNTRILVLEDDPDDQLFLQEAFRERGITAYQILPTEAALSDYLKGMGTLAAEPQVLLLANHPQRIQAIEVVRTLRALPAGRGLQVALYAAYPDPALAEAFALAGGNVFLLKPDSLAGYSALASRLEQLAYPERAAALG